MAVKHVKGKRVTIVGWFGNGNAGDEAILLGEVCSLRTEIPDSYITVISDDPATTEQLYGVRSIDSREKKAVLSTLSNTDLFILGGGGLLKPGSAKGYSHKLLLAKLLGAKTMVYAVSASPLKSKYERAITKLAINLCGMVTVRDAASRDTLLTMGVRRDIIVTADAAFAIPIDNNPTHHGGKLKSVSHPYIVLCLRQWDHEDLTEVQKFLSYNTFVKTMAKLCDLLVEEYNVSIVAVPMQVGSSESDIPIHRDLKSRCRHPELIHLVEEATAPKDILGILHGAELTVGMRLHSIIFSVMAGTSFVSLAYSPKVIGLVRTMHMEEYMVDLRYFEEDKLVRVVSKAYASRRIIREKLFKLAAEQRASALLNSKLAATMSSPI